MDETSKPDTCEKCGERGADTWFDQFRLCNGCLHSIDLAIWALNKKRKPNGAER